jgi:hypothetical protein
VGRAVDSSIKLNNKAKIITNGIQKMNLPMIPLINNMGRKARNVVINVVMTGAKTV